MQNLTVDLSQWLLPASFNYEQVYSATPSEAPSLVPAALQDGGSHQRPGNGGNLIVIVGAGVGGLVLVLAVMGVHMRRKAASKRPMKVIPTTAPSAPTQQS